MAEHPALCTTYEIRVKRREGAFTQLYSLGLYKLKKQARQLLGKEAYSASFLAKPPKVCVCVLWVLLNKHTCALIHTDHTANVAYYGHMHS